MAAVSSFVFALIPAVWSVDVEMPRATTYVRNHVNGVDLHLDYAANEFGHFLSTPTHTITPGSDGGWSMEGTGIDWHVQAGLIGYNVYYKKHKYGHCLCLSYFWDAVIGMCDSGFVNCPSGADLQRSDATNLTSFRSCSEAPGFRQSSSIVGSNGNVNVYIKDQNCAYGNPQHTFYSETPPVPVPVPVPVPTPVPAPTPVPVPVPVPVPTPVPAPTPVPVPVPVPAPAPSSCPRDIQFLLDMLQATISDLRNGKVIDVIRDLEGTLGVMILLLLDECFHTFQGCHLHAKALKLALEAVPAQLQMTQVAVVAADLDVAVSKLQSCFGVDGTLHVDVGKKPAEWASHEILSQGGFTDFVV